MNRDWPFGRGVFCSANNAVVAWVNGEDHLLLTASEDSTDVRGAYNRLAEVGHCPLGAAPLTSLGARTHQPNRRLLQGHRPWIPDIEPDEHRLCSANHHAH
jgi:hypothetical protein